MEQELLKRIQKLEDDYYRGNFPSSQDFQKYVRFNSRVKLPTYATLPTACEVGEVAVVSSTGKVYVCASTNTWAIIGTQS